MAHVFHGSKYRSTFARYATQLEQFIAKYKAPPPDIKYWPYGPYWPDHYYGEILDTPKYIRTIPAHPEPLYNNVNDDGK